MASVRTRAETGKLYIDFRADGMRFREQTELSDTPANRRRLSAVVARLDLALRAGQFRYAEFFPGSRNIDRHESVARTVSRPTVGHGAGRTLEDFSERWFTQNEVRWRRTTKSLVRQQLDSHILPRFGAKPLEEIGRQDLLDFRADLASPHRPGRVLSPKTVNDIFGLLKSIVDEAAASAGSPSPAANIKRLRVPRSDVEPFTLEECRRLIEAIRPDYRDYLVVRTFTGMRTGEVNGLRWKNVDLDRALVLVRETFTHGEMDETKTDGSWREVELPALVLQTLRRRMARVQARPEAFVFANAVGGPIDNHNFTKRVWYPLLRRLGIRPRRPYQLRHTAATLWLSAGENPTWIARQLGHSSLEMLYRTYARWTRNMTRRDGSSFDQLLVGHELGEQPHGQD
ncbi:site-specific integrase [Luteimonas pelagia]